MRFVLPLLVGLLGTAILVWLGLWQLDRREWKEGALAAIDARIGQAPAALPAAPDPVADAFLPVAVSGRFTGQDVDVLVGLKDLGAGVRIVAAFETAEGRRILVDRGFRPDAQRREPRVVTEATVSGNLHWPDDLNSSTPPPDARTGLWFARDLPAMAERLGTEPVLLVARSATGDGIRPLPLDSAGIPNDHLGYAIQWFGLAFVWAAMTAFWLWRNWSGATGAGRDKRAAMRYVSTRGAAPALTFSEAMMTGLARDGGLYVPEAIPVLPEAEIAALAGLPYEEVAFRVMSPFMGGTFAEDEFRGLLARAYRGFGHPARAPLRQLAPNHFLLELFHGPTLAFKDFAMQMIGQMMQAELARTGRRITIVGATSGDTGSAAIEAFRGLANVDVFILFPHGRVSEVQRRQMTTPTEANVHALALEGDFDDCQARVKDMFNDFAFRDAVGLAGVNSINWARVLAQVVYYFAAGVALGAPHRQVSFTVPTGNFGDIFAGFVAREMGLPIHRLVIATNQNDILHRCLETAAYTRHGVVPSISPSMDIEVSSNFERALYFAHGRDGAAVAALMADLAREGEFRLSPNAMASLTAIYDSGMADEARTHDTIAITRAETGELLCPHSAVGVAVAGRHLHRSPAVPMVTLATAHPAKFPDAVERASGLRPPLPARMAGLFDRPERVTRVPNDLSALETLIRDRIAA